MKRKPIYQIIYSRIRYLISGELQIGSPLPPERKLSEEWEVSRIAHAPQDE